MPNLPIGLFLYVSVCRGRIGVKESYKRTGADTNCPKADKAIGAIRHHSARVTYPWETLQVNNRWAGRFPAESRLARSLHYAKHSRRDHPAGGFRDHPMFTFKLSDVQSFMVSLAGTVMFTAICVGAAIGPAKAAAIAPALF